MKEPITTNWCGQPFTYGAKELVACGVCGCEINMSRFALYDPYAENTKNPYSLDGKGLYVCNEHYGPERDFGARMRELTERLATTSEIQPSPIDDREAFDMAQTIIEFLLRVGNNGWITTGQLDVYVRKGRHVINGVPIFCLDVANVILNDGLRKRGEGTFTKWLRVAEFVCSRLRNVEAIYVENVHNPRFLDFLLRKSYVETAGPSVYKFIGEKS